MIGHDKQSRRNYDQLALRKTRENVRQHYFGLSDETIERIAQRQTSLFVLVTCVAIRECHHIQKAKLN